MGTKLTCIECPEPSCDTLIASDRICCGEHWATVPYPLRQSVLFSAHRNRTRHQEAAAEVVKFLRSEPYAVPPIR